MEIICIDIGNSTIHLGISKGESITNQLSLPTKSLGNDDSELRKYLLENKAKKVSYCSVVPNAAVCLEKLLDEINSEYFRLTYDNCPGLKINYPNPQEIGQDRLANAIAAQEKYGAPAIVIDMGTAVTFDVVGKSGAYEGGVIAPGLEVMTRYLHEQTALLPKLDASDLITKVNIGKSTIDAMKLGCAVGFTGMINALLNRVLDGLDVAKKESIPVIGTGGSSGALLKDLNCEITIDHDITLSGLAVAFKRLINN